MLSNESATRFLFQLGVPRRKNTTERPRTKLLQPPLLGVRVTTVRLTIAKVPLQPLPRVSDDSEADHCQRAAATTAKREGDNCQVDHCPRATATIATSRGGDCEVDHCTGATATIAKSEGDDYDLDDCQAATVTSACG